MSTSLPPLVEPAAELTRDEVARYSRHLIIPDLGVDGQKRLKNARVLVIGAGGLGAPTLLYLAAAGVGTIGIVDFDVVDESNLQRQIIHGVSDIGRSKAQSARDSIAEVNPLVETTDGKLLWSQGVPFTKEKKHNLNTFATESAIDELASSPAGVPTQGLPARFAAPGTGPGRERHRVGADLEQGSEGGPGRCGEPGQEPDLQVQRRGQVTPPRPDCGVLQRGGAELSAAARQSCMGRLSSRGRRSRERRARPR